MEQTYERKRLRLNFNYKRGRLNIYRQNIVALNNPRFIKFMISPEKKLLFLCGIDIHELDCFPISYKDVDKKKRTDRIELSGLAFIRKISNIIGWDLEHPHVVEGILDADNRWIVFDLTKEVPLED